MTVLKSIFTAATALAVTAFTAIAGDFEGAWNVKDSDGKPFEITLGADGTAKADRGAEGMTGTWKAEGGAAVIAWNTGWTTKIAKDGSGYTKTAYAKGEKVDGKPANTSPAEKAK